MTVERGKRKYRQI